MISVFSSWGSDIEFSFDLSVSVDIGIRIVFNILEHFSDAGTELYIDREA
jgi:hypothetical protein